MGLHTEQQQQMWHAHTEHTAHGRHLLHCMPLLIIMQQSSTPQKGKSLLRQVLCTILCKGLGHYFAHAAQISITSLYTQGF